MKMFRHLVVVALTIPMVALPGCIITSAQILTHFSLPNPFTINSAVPGDQSERVPVDLAVDVGSDYTDNKGKLQGLLDLAILGTFTNENGPAGAVEVYIVPSYDTPAGGSLPPPQGAVLLWGPVDLGAAGGPDATRTLTWDDSAALFNPAGKQLLIDEVKGDGQFTLYIVGTAGVYSIRVDNGVVSLVLDASE